MGWVVENESTTKQSQSEIIIVYYTTLPPTLFHTPYIITYSCIMAKISRECSQMRNTIYKLRTN